MPVIPIPPNTPPLFGGQAQIWFGVRDPRRPIPQLDRRTDEEKQIFRDAPREPEPSSTVLGPLFDDGLAYASAIHRTQRRKGGDIPYVAHLLGTAAIALEMGADEEEAIAALLHDAVEDQGGATRLADIEQRYGKKVAGIVADCSDSCPEDDSTELSWRARKEAYVASLASKPRPSLLVSLADKTHNARTIVDDLAMSGPVIWDRFTAGRAGTVWYYVALATAFELYMPGPYTKRLTRLANVMAAPDV